MLTQFFCQPAALAKPANDQAADEHGGGRIATVIADQVGNEMSNNAPSAFSLAQLRHALTQLPNLPDGDALAQAARTLCNTVLRQLPLSGAGAAALRMEALLAVAAHDLNLARVIEAHMDAMAIYAEADNAGYTQAATLPLHGVWAARHPTQPLQVTRHAHGWQLIGVLPFCTGAQHVDAALVAADFAGTQRLFCITRADLPPTLTNEWHASGMQRMPTATVKFETDAQVTLAATSEVGGDGFYLRRRGFWIGAMMVASCWLGGAIGVLRCWHSLITKQQATTHGRDAAHGLAHLGACLAAVDAARVQLFAAAQRSEDAQLHSAQLQVIALSVRHVIEQACQQVITAIGRALGPAPLIFDAYLARQLADLQLYVRQSHAERDLAQLATLAINEANAGVFAWL